MKTMLKKISKIMSFVLSGLMFVSPLASAAGKKVSSVTSAKDKVTKVVKYSAAFGATAIGGILVGLVGGVVIKSKYDEFNSPEKSFERLNNYYIGNPNFVFSIDVLTVFINKLKKEKKVSSDLLAIVEKFVNLSLRDICYTTFNGGYNYTINRKLDINKDNTINDLIKEMLTKLIDGLDKIGNYKEAKNKARLTELIDSLKTLLTFYNQEQ